MFCETNSFCLSTVLRMNTSLQEWIWWLIAFLFSEYGSSSIGWLQNNLLHVKDTIFLHVKILVQRTNEKPRGIFHLINQIQCFIIRISVVVFSISVCLPDVHFLRIKRAFLRAKPGKNFPDGWILILYCTLLFMK